MYQVLLVDDERMILEGISNVVDWSALGTELAGTARNGLEAYEKIARMKPDIVISDIKMPGMDGLSLVQKVRENFPATRFIMLSGFSEFEYARSAMKYGVKHFLLKPSNEGKIMEALQEVICDIQEEEKKTTFIQGMRSRFEMAQPYIQEQVLKEFIGNKTYTSRDLAHYQKLFHLEFTDQKVQLILFQLEGSFDFEHMHALKNIAKELFQSAILSTIMKEHVLVLVEEQRVETLQELLHTVRERFAAYYGMDTTVAVSEAGHIRSVRRLYQESLECLAHRFYVGEGSVISKKDIDINETKTAEMEFDEQKLCLLIKSGHWEDVQEEIRNFFAAMAHMRLGIPVTKSHIMQLLLAIVQTCDIEHMPLYMEKISHFMNMERIQQMQTFFEEIAKDITLMYYDKHKTKHSSIIQKVLLLVDEHLGNPDLSLKWVAGQILYMNADYLGKLFKQETGERFSSYVMRVRIERAVKHIQTIDDVKVGVLAEMTGFGDNPQYFSQVFKKYTGRTPSEYRKAL